MIVLKIIGIILLALFGLLLLAVGLILFVPIRYRIFGESEEDAVVHVRVTWLLHLISWRADYQNKDFSSAFRILGIHPKDKDGAKERFAVSEDEEDSEGAFADEQEQTADRAESDIEVITDKESGIERGAKAEQESEIRSRAELRQESEIRSRAKLGQDSERARKEGIFFKLKNKALEIKQRLVHGWKLLGQVKDRASMGQALISDETNRLVAGMVLRELKYLLRHFKFRRIDTDLRFSLGDPAATGQALGVLAVMPFVYQYRFQVYPDFESEDVYLKGTYSIQGRARGVHILVALVRLLRQGEFRSVVGRLLNRS